MQRASLPAPGCMERGYCMEKNKGVTLIELIVVIGIMGLEEVGTTITLDNDGAELSLLDGCTQKQSVSNAF